MINLMHHPPFIKESPSDYLHNKLLMPATNNDVTLQYSSATRRYIWTPIVDRYWTRWQFDLIATGLWKLNQVEACDVIKGWPDSDVSITYGGVWSTGTPAAALNATYHYSPTAGRTAQFDVTGVDKIYLILSTLSNGGYGAVTINGGTALVNELPLVGGYRQIDCYSAVNAYNNRILIASNLDPGQTYTVLVTVQGTAPGGSTGTRVYIEGYGTLATTINDVQVWACTNFFTNVLYGYSGSENECALDYLPVGATLYAWTGSGHGNENITSVTWKDQLGNDKSVSVGTPRNNAASIILAQAGTTRHPETTPTNHANVNYQHTFSSQGMDIYHKHVWLTTASIRTGYSAMWALREEINRGHVAGDYNAIYDLSLSDSAFHGQLRERLAALWKMNSPYVCWLYISNLDGVNGWLNSQTRLSIEDRVAGLLNKIYFQRVGGTAVNVAIGEIWENTAYYRISRVASPETWTLWV